MERALIDRRVVRTRTALQQALKTLILQKGYEAITITDICNTANVGRSTFYAHYTSKDDLKRGGLEHLRQLFFDRHAAPAAGNAVPRPFGFSLALFEHARDDIELYRAMVGGRGTAVSLDSIREILSDRVREEVATLNRSSSRSITEELIVQYVVGAFVSVLTWWLDRGAKISPEQIETLLRRTALEGVQTGCGCSDKTRQL